MEAATGALPAPGHLSEAKDPTPVCLSESLCVCGGKFDVVNAVPLIPPPIDTEIR